VTVGSVSQPCCWIAPTRLWLANCYFARDSSGLPSCPYRSLGLTDHRRTDAIPCNNVTRRLWSGRTVARIGLRMMPPFPQSPLSSVRRVFPSTAGRLAFQAAPSPVPRGLSQHQACPAHHVGLRLPFVHSVASSSAPLCVGTMDSVMHRHSRSWLLYPRGPRSGLGYSVPVHLRLFDLIRPTRRRIPISPQCDLYGMPSLCWCA
jgi:hypothetical protein